MAKKGDYTRLGMILDRIMENNDLTKSAFGDLLVTKKHPKGISGNFVGQICRGQRFPSDDLLVKIATMFGGTKTKREQLLKDLRIATLEGKMGPAAEAIREETREAVVQICRPEGEAASPEFIEKLNQDVKKSGKNLEQVASEVQVPSMVISNLLNGTGFISRDLLVGLADTLGQNADEYLLMNGYLPAAVSTFHKDFPKIIRALARLNKPEVVSAVTVLLDNLQASSSSE